MTTLSVNLREVLSFFDEDRSVTKHSNAIKTLAGEEFMFELLLNYFRRSGATADLVSRKCTTGKSRGRRLDGWVKTEKFGQTTYYQVEVKSWSAHGVGGGSRFVSPNANAAELAKYRREVWALYWANGRFIEDGLNKVLTPMKCPTEGFTVRPLACLWAPVHPKGQEDPFFTVALDPPTPFSKVDVFSASSFLRGVAASESELKLVLPDVAERMMWLNRLFSPQ